MENFILIIVIVFLITTIPPLNLLRYSYIKSFRVFIFYDFSKSGFGGNFIRVFLCKDYLLTGVFFLPIKRYYKDISGMSIKRSYIPPFSKLIIHTKQSKKGIYFYSRRSKLEKIKSEIEKLRK